MAFSIYSYFSLSLGMALNASPHDEGYNSEGYGYSSDEEGSEGYDSSDEEGSEGYTNDVGE